MRAILGLLIAVAGVAFKTHGYDHMADTLFAVAAGWALRGIADYLAGAERRQLRRGRS